MQRAAQATELNSPPSAFPTTVFQRRRLLVLLIPMLLSETHTTWAKISGLHANCPPQEKLPCFLLERLR